MFCSNCGQKLGEEDVYCSGCGKKVPVYHREQKENNHGEIDKKINRKEEIDDFQNHVINTCSWAAAVFPGWYFIFMGDWGFFWLFLFAGALSSVAKNSSNLYALFLVLPALLLWIWGVCFGKRVAWNTRKWKDFDQFLAVQRKWDLAAKVWLVISSLLLILLVLPILLFVMRGK